MRRLNLADGYSDCLCEGAGACQASSAIRGRRTEIFWSICGCCGTEPERYLCGMREAELRCSNGGGLGRHLAIVVVSRG